MYLSIYQNSIGRPHATKLSARHTLKNIGKFVNEVKALTGITGPVYIFRSEVMKRLSIPKYKNVKWINFYELAEAEITKAVNASSLGNIVSNKGIFARIERNFDCLRTYLNNHNKGAVHSLLNNIKLIRDELKNNNNAKLTEFAELFDIEPKAASINLENDVKEALKSYPLLTILEDVYDRSKYAKSLSEYVILLDK
jgi:hypothetical protein